MLFDTFHDRRNGYLFYANPIGGLADSQITDEGPPNTDWNTVWDVKTAIFDQGWTIEIAIPFKSLRYQPEPEQTWGINLRRVVRWKNEWSYLTQVPRALTTFRGILKISSAGTLVGLRVPTSTRNMEVKPYVLGGVTTDRTLAQPLSNDVTRRAGGDFRYGVTENLTADLTLNTDFAQVEVDEQQVNLTRFNLFFPEKRDFFLENLGVFAFAGRASAGLAAGTGDTPYLFFSRRIGLDDVRTVPLRVGAADDRQVGQAHLRCSRRPHRRRLDRTRSTRRTSRCSGRSATFSAAAASEGWSRTGRRRRASSERTRRYGVDTALGFYENVRIDAYLAKTQFGRPHRPRRQLSRVRSTTTPIGMACRSNGSSSSRTSGRRSASSGAPTCGAAPGWLASVRGPTSLDPVRKLTFQGNINYITNTANRLDSREQIGSFQTEFTNSDVAGVSYTDTFERLVRPFAIVPGVVIPIGAYDFHTVQLSYTAGQQRPVSGGVVYEQGTFYDGDRRSISVNSARVQVTPRVSIEPSLTLNWIELPQRTFTTSVVRGRATFTVTPRMFFSGIAQYNSTARSVEQQPAAAMGVPARQ